MTWPTLQDYNEAIQSPHLNFSDPELKAGTVETNALGLPRPITGAFATVYRVRCSTREWAVRCFQRDFTDQQLRYEAISKHLSAAQLPYMVGFNFLPQGIRVSGSWYPILKMEWIKGELLHKYIKRNLGDPGALLSLAAQWAAMIKTLQEAKIAHGDLQHGNVLIANGQLRLIDYDGMYVPALAGMFSHEAGHRNYQHPQRTEFDFGSSVDNFSAWVIYVSLLALSIDPRLWDRTKAGDECLLFRQQDFEEPYTSEALNHLSRHSDQRLYTLASFFQSLLYQNPAQLPELDGQPALQGLSLPSQITTTGAEKGLPLWLRDHVVTGAISTASRDDAKRTENSTWVLDFISPSGTVEPKLLEPDTFKPQILLLVTTATCVLLVVLYFETIVSLVPTAVLVLMIGVTIAAVLRSLYRTDSVVITMLEINRREAEEKDDIDKSQREIKATEARKVETRKKENDESNAIDSQLAAMQTQERIEKGKVQVRLNLALKAFNARRQVINRNEAEALRRIQERTGAVVARLNNQIAALITRERDELTNTLRNLQQQAVRAYLVTRSVEDGTIHGVGEKLKSRLRYYGIRTAADVEYWKVSQVDGIGSSKATSLLAWRNHLASFATVPTSLNTSQIATIRTNYTLQRQPLLAQRDASQQELNMEVNSVRAKAANEIKALNDEQSVAQSKTVEELRIISDQCATHYLTLTQNRSKVSFQANEKCKRLDEQFARIRKRIGEEHWRLAKTRRELMAYNHVSFRAYLRRVMGFRLS